MDAKYKPKLVALDYDGTLAGSDSQIAQAEHRELLRLGELGIHRVVATGRSLFSADEVLTEETPIDFLVFSSGVGVMEWKTRKMLHRNEMKAELAEEMIDELIRLKLDFMVHHPAPENHNFHYHHGGNENPDFFRRIDRYSKYAIPWNDSVSFEGISQLLVVVEENGEKYLDYLRREYQSLNVVRTTSPLDHQSMWIEVFPKEVSKAEGIRFLTQRLGVGNDEILCVGNDFNDLDMLRFAGKSFVVGNAPDELKSEFPSIASNDDGGVGDLLAQIFN